tara:strand:+ start:116 stop:601 length:486 start_codon:yes stop_codon:yes gene_type:complete
MSDTLNKVSKTQKKREAIALLELGRDLTNFPDNSLEQLQLDPKLKNAINEFKKLFNTRGAKKRQLQYIGRLLRENQNETLLKQIRHLSSSPKQSPRYPVDDKIFERIISEGDQAINEIVCKQHNFDRQKLRQLKSNILKSKPEKRESAENKLRAYIKIMNE